MEVPEEGRATRRRIGSSLRSPFIIWLLTFFLLSVLEWLWVLATPLGSGFDEPSHVIKAAATVRGEWLGQPVPHLSRAYTWMIVPATFSELTDRTVCYKLSVRIPASCEPPVAASGAPVRARTHVGRYPPLYYLFTGLPSLFGHSTSVLYWMRLAGAIVSAAFVAMAVALATTSSGGGMLLAAVIAATTPSVFYLGSIVEPSSLETSASICLWTCLLLLRSRRQARVPRHLVLGATASGVALVLARGLSPLWLLAVLFVTLVVVTPASRLRAIWKSAAARSGAVIIGAATCLALSWTAVTGSLAFVSVHPNPYAHAAYTEILKAIFARTTSYVVQMLGGFNPKHTQAPVGDLALVGGCVAVLVVVGIIRGSWRERSGLALVAAATLLAPLVLASVHARTVGIIWQGRYILPIAVGLPLIAGMAADDAPEHGQQRWRSSKLAAGVVAAALSGQLLALYGLLRRFTVGNRGPMDLTLKSGHAWAPPIPAVAVICGAVLATAATVIWLVFLINKQAGHRGPEAGAAYPPAVESPARAEVLQA